MTARKTFSIILLVLASLCGLYLLVFINIVFWDIEYVRQKDWLSSLAGSAVVIGVISLYVGGNLSDKD